MSAPAGAAPPPRRRRRWAPAAVWTASLAALSALALAWLLGTQGGLETAARLARWAVPGLEIGAVRGRLAGPLALEGLRLEQGGLGPAPARLELERLELDWRPLELLRGRLHLTRLHLAGLAVHLPPASDPSASGPSKSEGGGGRAALPRPLFRPPPLPLRVDRLLVERLRVRRGTAPAFRIDRLEAALRLDRNLALEGLAVRAGAWGVEGRARLGLEGPAAVAAGLAWRARPAGLRPLRGRLRLEGALAGTVELEAHLEAPWRARLEGRVREPLATGSWEARLTLRPGHLEALLPGAPPGRLAGALEARGRLAGARGPAGGAILEGHLRLEGLPALPAPGLEARLRLRLTAGLVRVDRLALAFPGGGRLSLAGTVRASGMGRGTSGGAELEGRWEALAWPPPPSPPAPSERAWRSPAGLLALEGGPGAWRLRLAGVLEGPGLPPLSLTLAGSGDAQGLVLERLHGALLGGRLAGAGWLRWSGGLAWAARLRARGLDPGLHWPAWPGRLDLELAAEGMGRGREGVLRLELEELAGRLRGAPLRGRALLRGRDGALRLEALALEAGPNRLRLAGPLTPEPELRWRLEAPRPALLLPGLAGDLRGAGELGGRPARPRLTATLRARGLGWAGWALEEGTLVAALDPRAPWSQVLALEASGLRPPRGAGLERLELHLAGPPESLTLALEARAPAGGFLRWLRLLARGGLEEGRWEEGRWEGGRWRGHLAELEVVEPGDTWRLEAPAPLLVVWGAGDGNGGDGKGADGSQRGAGWAVRLGRACLRAGEAALCGEGGWTPRRWEAALEGKGLPLARLRPLLPAPWRLKGRGEVEARLAASPAPLAGRLALRLAPGALTGPAPGGGPFRLAWREAGASAVLDGARLAVRARAALAEGAGRLALRLRAPRAALPPPLGPSPGGWAAVPVEGRAEVALRDLALLTPFLPELEDPRGRLEGRLALGGRAGAPRLRGALRLRDGGAGLPDLGIRVSEADLVLEAPGDGSLRLSGGLRSEGLLRLEGEGRWAPGGPPEARLRLRGRRVLLARLPELELHASPDLRLDLRGRELTLDGELEVPRARLRPERMALAVEPSPDVAVAGRQRPPERWRLRGSLVLRLGEDVRFGGYGLQARLAGAVALLAEPGRPPSAAGVLRISEGRYRAYGQRLRIEDGKLLFYGGPVDDPGLDLRAVRRVEDVTVGVRLLGRLRRPRATLFSEPPLPQTEALSYLVLGHGTEGSTSAEGRRLQRAAAALGLAGGGLLAEQLGRRLGLGELRLESGEGFGQGALMLRRYLGPRLYVSYGVGLFERFSAFVLRYRLSTLWSLEARSGLQRGADLLYELESH